MLQRADFVKNEVQTKRRKRMGAELKEKGRK